MTHHPDPILDFDLQAYIDDQLNVQRRIEVEAYLSRHPDAAARMMADLRVRDELRLGLAHDRMALDMGAARPATRDAARRLEQALTRAGRMTVLRRAAAIAIFIGVGWVAHSVINPFAATQVIASVPTPAFVREALQAHETTLLRESLHPQQIAQDQVGQGRSGSPMFDRKEIRSATGIVMPDLPSNWTIADSQIFPSDYGPSVEIAVKPKRGSEVTLFAARTGSFAVQNVTLAQTDGAKAAYWQIGEVAYALVSKDRSGDELTDVAGQLARTLY
ncbi:transcriptional regulator (anti-sigma factor) [Agrobacterium vitis]|uniref:anti-sigma factor family protein n=1 Tax=Agrobacterium vitis TaxID=373 RepID=UPI0015D8C9A7|nr:anti-sigma factor [Agrobacterium vitis]BCH61606.1 transcriptional regulator (anti-sigma factor) [Agrobacterium vitis]